MISLDTSTLIAYFSGNAGPDVEACDQAFRSGQVVLPPVVLCEILSDPLLSVDFLALIKSLPRLSIDSEYWIRAGLLRADILSKGLKARVADALIAQNCIDHDLPLITRDADFRHFSRYAGLRLL